MLTKKSPKMNLHKSHPTTQPPNHPTDHLPPPSGQSRPWDRRWLSPEAAPVRSEKRVVLREKPKGNPLKKEEEKKNYKNKQRKIKKNDKNQKKRQFLFKKKKKNGPPQPRCAWHDRPNSEAWYQRSSWLRRKNTTGAWGRKNSKQPGKKNFQASKQLVTFQ